MLSAMMLLIGKETILQVNDNNVTGWWR